jgi:hypothetical protein
MRIYLCIGDNKKHEDGENCIMRSFKICSDQIKEDDLGRACSVHSVDEKFIQNFIQTA